MSDNLQAVFPSRYSINLFPTRIRTGKSLRVCSLQPKLVLKDFLEQKNIPALDETVGQNPRYKL